MFKKSIIVGLIASFVPIYMMSYQFKDCVKNGYNYPQTVRMLPIMFIILNIILLPLLNKFFNIKNYFIIGAIMSIIYSTIGRLQGVPQKLFNMNPNLFQLSALVIWTLFYGLVIKNLI